MYEITHFRHVTPCSLVDLNNDIRSCNTLKCNKKTRVTSADTSGAIWHMCKATGVGAASTASNSERYSQFMQCGMPAAAAVSNRNMGTN
jgi:hypothetical protein